MQLCELQNREQQGLPFYVYNEFKTLKEPLLQELRNIRTLSFWFQMLFLAVLQDFLGHQAQEITPHSQKKEERRKGLAKCTTPSARCSMMRQIGLKSETFFFSLLLDTYQITRLLNLAGSFCNTITPFQGRVADPKCNTTPLR